MRICVVYVHTHIHIYVYIIIYIYVFFLFFFVICFLFVKFRDSSGGSTARFTSSPNGGPARGSEGGVGTSGVMASPNNMPSSSSR